MDIVCCTRFCSWLKNAIWHKANLTKMAMLPFCYFWINLLCNSPMIRIKPQTNGFAFNYWVWKGLWTCNQVQTMLDGSCNLYQYENAMDQKWVFAKFKPSILPNHKWFWRVLGHFGKLVTCSTIHLWNEFWGSKCNYVKNGHEDRSKSCLN